MMTIARRRRPQVTFACVDCAIPVTASYGVPSGIIGLRCYPCALQAWRNGLADYPQPKVRCAQCGNPLPRSRIRAPSGGCSPDCPHMAPFCSAFCPLYASLNIRTATPSGRAPGCPSP